MWQMARNLVSMIGMNVDSFLIFLGVLGGLGG